MPAAEATPTPAPWPALLRDTEAARFLGISRRQVWKGAATGALPAPIQLPGLRATRWKLDELAAFVAGIGGGR